MADLLDQTKLRAHLKKMSNTALRMLESRVDSRLAAIQKCMSWPALEQTLTRDLEAIWQEQRLRGIKKS